MPSFPSYSTTRRICQITLASSTLILLHSLLIAGISLPCASANDSSQNLMAIKEEVQFQGTLVVISMLWMVFSLLEERSITPLHVEGEMAERYRPVLTSISVEWALITLFTLEWIGALFLSCRTRSNCPQLSWDHPRCCFKPFPTLPYFLQLSLPCCLWLLFTQRCQSES